MWIVRVALNRPYTFIVLALLIMLASPVIIMRTPTDIFPNINIPVVAVAWQFTGLNPEEMEGRFTTGFERILTTTVDNIEHIESTTINGQAIIKIFLQPNASLDTANAQITAVSQVYLRQLPAGAQPPIILNFSASTVPIIQLALSGEGLSEQQLNDLGLNFLRTQLVTVPGAAVPYPYGGKQTQVMIDLNPALLQSKGLSATDVVNAVNLQNLVLPSGTAKIGQFEYDVNINGAPRTVEQLNDIPIKQVGSSTIYLRDVAHVRNGFAPQTNIVRHAGLRGVLVTVLKAGSASTLDIVNGIRTILPRIAATLPPQLKIQPLADQSIFVRAAVSGVIREAVIAACLTGLMILIFLASWRSTLIIAVSIPLSILTSIIILSFLGETINIMTLGGLALAVGMLVDDATVEIENTNRNLDQGKETKQAILDGASQIAVPALVSTLCICIVFLPMFFLTGAAKYLFTPLAMAVVFAMLASYLLSRTLIPTMVHHMLRPEMKLYAMGEHGETAGGSGFIWRAHYLFNRRFEMLRSNYTSLLQWSLDHRIPVLAGFTIFSLGSLGLATLIGSDFFPTVDSGQMRLHAQAPAGTRIEQTEVIFAGIEREIRQVIPSREIDTIIDNIGIPNSGFNLAFGHSAVIGTGDGDILISLKEGDHGPTAEYIDRLRKRLNQKFPDVVFFFEAANITNQILNFGLPAAIDVQVIGRDAAGNYELARQIAAKVAQIPGAADVHIHQVVDYPTIDINVDRSKAGQVGLTQRDVATSLLISLSSSGQIAPTQFLDYRTGVSYNVSVQTPQYRMDSVAALLRTPVGAPANVVTSNTSTSSAGTANQSNP